MRLLAAVGGVEHPARAAAEGAGAGVSVDPTSSSRSSRQFSGRPGLDQDPPAPRPLEVLLQIRQARLPARSRLRRSTARRPARRRARPARPSRRSRPRARRTSARGGCPTSASPVARLVRRCPSTTRRRPRSKSTILPRTVASVIPRWSVNPTAQLPPGPQAHERALAEPREQVRDAREGVERVHGGSPDGDGADDGSAHGGILIRRTARRLPRLYSPPMLEPIRAALVRGRPRTAAREKLGAEIERVVLERPPEARARRPRVPGRVRPREGAEEGAARDRRGARRGRAPARRACGRRGSRAAATSTSSSTAAR